MTIIFDSAERDGVALVRLRSPQLEVDVAPEVGGRIVQLRHRDLGYAFLWTNANLPLEPKPPGTAYDPWFYGGIDELLPCDVPERIDDIDYPDHGELWTTRFDWRIDGESLVLAGRLPRCGLLYERRMLLRADRPQVDLHYRITNASGASRHFLWKLHAALAVAAGDRIDCPARQGQVVDRAYSRFDTLSPFPWPHIAGQRADMVPPNDGTVDFFYLFDLEEGRLAWKRPSAKMKFQYTFDTAVFPFAWLFASYGGFDGHYTTILEPCSTMPIELSQAIRHGRCSRLGPGEVLETCVSIYAGPDEAMEV